MSNYDEDDYGDVPVSRKGRQSDDAGQGRIPPHAIQAEEALLGAMLLSKVAIAKASEMVTAGDFYKPNHGTIFQSIMNLYEHGDPVDAVTVADDLTRLGMLDFIGGPATLINLQSATPATSSAGRYAQTVSDMSVLRKVIAVSIEATNAAYNPDVDVASLIETTQEGYAEAISGLMGEEPSDLWILDEFLDRPLADRPPWVIPGMLRKGWRAMVVAAEGSGKALDLDTLLPSPDGWTTMGDIEVGDRLFDIDGAPCTVKFATEIQMDRDCYEVVFSDGSVIVADADHRWLTHTLNEREKGKDAQERTTREIAESLRVTKKQAANHSVPTCGALRYKRAVVGCDLPIDPYLLGIWLGDGASRGALISSADPEIVQTFEDAGYTMAHAGGYDWRITGAKKWDRSVSFKSALRRLGLIQNKHIPAQYLQASVQDRTALLQGLMDSDGTIGTNGRAEFSVTSEVLARGAHELIVGLGHKTRMTESAATLYGREVSRRWRMSFMPVVEAFRLPRKAERQRVGSRRAFTRYIVDVRPVESRPVRCVQVDSPTHTYLAGESCIPTHNTVLFRQIGIAAAQGIHPLSFGEIDPARVLIVDLENPEDSIHDVCTPLRVQTEAVSTNYDSERAYLWHKPGGINLRNRRDRMELETVIAKVRPDLVCLGPIYKCYNVAGNESDEQAAKEVMQCFDDLRTRYNFALLLEHHAPKGNGKSRDLLPYGSSLWLRWPEIGLKLTPKDANGEAMTVGRWRGDRLENSWPDELHRGKPWMWRGKWPDGTFTEPNAPRSSIISDPRFAAPAILPAGIDPETGEILVDGPQGPVGESEGNGTDDWYDPPF